MDRLFALRLSGDFYTKARQTRLRFLRRLSLNLEDALSSHGIPHRLERTWSRMYLESPDAAAPEVVARVFGVQSVSEIVRRPWASLEDVVREGEAFFRDGVRGKSFAVRASRRGRRGDIPFDSPAVESALGRALLPYAARVDLEHPQATAHVEVEPGSAQFFHQRTAGLGGLPVGVEGRAVALVSGGFDSAVAAWLLLKRGVQLDYVFCNLGGTAHRLGALRVMRVIAERWSYGYRPRLHEIDFRPLAAQLQERTRSRDWQLHLKRLMLRSADALARNGGAAGIVTGDAIGQVSSQTLQNLAVVSQAVTTPILRPLLGFNKEEILALARRAGVYELAAAVGEFCALVPRRPATRARLDSILAGEAALDPTALRAAVRDRTRYDLRSLTEESLAPPALEVDRIPEGSTVLDLRSAAAFDAWHYPGSLHLDFPRAVAAYPSFGRDRTYLLVCEVGLKSAHLAERMQQAGLAAFHLKGGTEVLMRLAEAAPTLLAPAVRED
jgi:thiamine biosynthesis protein ThiI